MQRFLTVSCFLLFLVFKGIAQDSTFLKTAYAGAYLLVPEGQTWKLDRAFINSGDTYSIQINSSNFESYYTSGDTIRLPFYSAEMELLDKKDLVLYQLYFKRE
ncbi:MAG: hypothetical protein A3D92_05015 [Bacteroidetes bacterium RIFCSPHIGHO2_02_FULL_44_7]|nr:MAG: hypothetical protein A3D92_05015 [Bacteroidetes bacterium RIFCSPHIGHO2_02_FULL_44_7]